MSLAVLRLTLRSFLLRVDLFLKPRWIVPPGHRSPCTHQYQRIAGEKVIGRVYISLVNGSIGNRLYETLVALSLFEQLLDLKFDLVFYAICYH